MDDKKNNKDKIVTLVSKSNEESTIKYRYNVTYIDGTKDVIIGEYFGVSRENPDFILFGEGDEDDVPPTLVRASLIKKVITEKV